MGIIDYSTLTDLHLLTLLAVLRAWTWEALVRVVDPDPLELDTTELDIFIGFFRK